MKKIIALGFLAFFISAFKFSSAQKIVFAQDNTYKNNMFSKKLMGAFIVEDSINDEKLIIYSGAKTVNFYHTDGKWKLLKTFEVPFEKKSAFATDRFDVVSYNHEKNIWNLIVMVSGEIFTAERVDMTAGTYSVAGNVFEDKKPNWSSLSFPEGKVSYNFYVNRSGGFTLASIDENQTIKTTAIDLTSQLPVNKNRKLDPVNDIYAKVQLINYGLASSIAFTRRKNQFYLQPGTFSFLIASDEEPFAEYMVFDKKTGKRIRTELFSTENLLPENVKSGHVNNNALFYDNKIWMLTAHKNGGVLAAFDPETKKLISSIVYDDNTTPPSAVYGPVFYKMQPGGVNARQEFKTVRDKVDDMSMNSFCKEMYKERPCIYMIPLSEKEYAVNIGSYAVVEQLAPQSATGERVRSSTTYYYNPFIYKSAVIGFIMNKASFTLESRRSDFNDINNRNAGERYNKIQVDYSNKGEEPEFKDKRKSFVMRELRNNNLKYTIYHYDGQVKVAVTDLSQE